MDVQMSDAVSTSASAFHGALPEILYSVFQYAVDSSRDLCAIMSTCRRWRKLLFRKEMNNTWVHCLRLEMEHDIRTALSQDEMDVDGPRNTQVFSSEEIYEKMIKMDSQRVLLGSDNVDKFFDSILKDYSSSSATYMLRDLLEKRRIKAANGKLHSRGKPPRPVNTAVDAPRRGNCSQKLLVYVQEREVERVRATMQSLCQSIKHRGDSKLACQEALRQYEALKHRRDVRQRFASKRGKDHGYARYIDAMMLCATKMIYCLLTRLIEKHDRYALEFIAKDLQGTLGWNFFDETSQLAIDLRTPTVCYGRLKYRHPIEAACNVANWEVFMYLADLFQQANVGQKWSSFSSSPFWKPAYIDIESYQPRKGGFDSDDDYDYNGLRKPTTSKYTILMHIVSTNNRTERAPVHVARAAFENLGEGEALNQLVLRPRRFCKYYCSDSNVFETYISYAASCCWCTAETLRYLIVERGMSFRVRDATGMTPLQRLVEHYTTYPDDAIFSNMLYIVRLERELRQGIIDMQFESDPVSPKPLPSMFVKLEARIRRLDRKSAARLQLFEDPERPLMERFSDILEAGSNEK